MKAVQTSRKLRKKWKLRTSKTSILFKPTRRLPTHDLKVGSFFQFDILSCSDFISETIKNKAFLKILGMRF